MNSIWHIIKPGLWTTVQDLGRTGFQAQGVPANGVMDKTSAKMANWLVGNPEEYPVLEITILGPQIEISGLCQIAITGADLSPKLDGQLCPMNQTLTLDGHTKLTFGKQVQGSRAYIAIRGKWGIQSWLESCSATAFDATILTPDSILRKNTILHIEATDQIEQRIISSDLLLETFTKSIIRVLPGPDFEAFSVYAIGYFFSRAYVITKDSNRMGFRLDATIIDFKPNREVISSGTVPGTIQITNAGQPIILMADAQTSGGYFRLGNVISADFDLLAQKSPGDAIRFELVKAEEALEALQQKRRLEAILLT